MNHLLLLNHLNTTPLELNTFYWLGNEELYCFSRLTAPGKSLTGNTTCNCRTRFVILYLNKIQFNITYSFTFNGKLLYFLTKDQDDNDMHDICLLQNL